MLKSKTAWFGAGLIVCAAPAFAGEAVPPPSATQVAEWIHELDDENFAVREAAGQKLVVAGRAAIAPVAKAILSDSPEAAWRANEVLEQIGITGDEQTLELVSQALADVSKSSKHSLAKSTSEVQRRWKLLRHERAVAQISKLGGHVRGTDGEMLAFAGGFGGAMPAIAFEAMPVEAEADIDLDDDVEEPAKEIDRIILDKLKELDLKAVPAEAPKIEVGDDPLDAPPAPPARIERIVPPAEIVPGDKPESDKIEIFRVEPPRALKDFAPEPPAADDPFGGEPEAPKPEERPAAKGLFGKMFRALRDVLPVDRPIDPPADAEPMEAEVLEAMEFVPDAVEFADMAMAVDFETFETLEGDEEGAHAVRLGKEWKGGAEGLRLLKDVMHLSALEIHELEVTEAHVEQIQQLPELRQVNLQRCRFDRAAVAKLKKAKPDLTVLTYGEAVMGISGEARGEGFHVSFVAPSSGAQACGLLVDDVVVKLADEELQSFEQLTHIVASRKIGDKLGVEVLRQGKKLSLEVTLKAREPGN